jgi:hypothetical protein
MAYANAGDGEKALETVERGLAMVPGPAAGQKASDARQNLENEERDMSPSQGTFWRRNRPRMGVRKAIL